MMTALIVAYRARKPPAHEASIVVRVIEGDIDPNSAPPTSTQLQDYLWQVVLNRPTLIDVIEENDLYPSKLRIDPGFAVETMREDLDIDVMRNYFAAQRYGEDPPRTARIRIRYAGRTPDHALSAVRHIARLIGEREARNREIAAQYASDSARRAAEGLQDRYVRLQREQVRLRQELERNPSAMDIVVELQGIRRRLSDMEREMRDARTEASTLDLRIGIESRAMGLQFEIVDSGTADRPLMSQQTKLILLGAFSFLFLLPVVGVAVGAYDLRIY
ncbi:MAG: hypothetical protein ACOC1F_06990, partial [Myxococcota bacterium]